MIKYLENLVYPLLWVLFFLFVLQTLVLVFGQQYIDSLVNFIIILFQHIHNHVTPSTSNLFITYIHLYLTLLFIKRAVFAPLFPAFTSTRVSQ